MAGFHLHSGYKTKRIFQILELWKIRKIIYKKKFEKNMKNLSKNVVNAKLSDNINMPSIWILMNASLTKVDIFAIICMLASGHI